MSSNDAPGLLAATEFQFVRALVLLARSPKGSRVGLETGDDVSQESPAGNRINEQAKNSLSKANPFTDRSIGLWKTLGIWCRAASRKDGDKISDFVLLTNASVTSGLAREMADAADDLAIQSCLRKLHDIAEDASKTLRKHCQTVQKFGNEVLCSVISRIRLCDGTSADLSDFYVEVAGALHIPEGILDDQLLVNNLAQWVHNTAIQKWLKGEPAWLRRADFDLAFFRTVQALQIRGPRVRGLDFVEVSDERAAVIADGARFIDHMRRIELDRADLQNGINCFLRFEAEWLRLLEQGEVTDLDWGDFNSRLCERWGMICRRKARLPNVPPVSRGQEIFFETVDADWAAPLGSYETRHPYFTSGAYHRLADEDIVHWHPDFHEQSPTEE